MPRPVLCSSADMMSFRCHCPPKHPNRSTTRTYLQQRFAWCAIELRLLRGLLRDMRRTRMRRHPQRRGRCRPFSCIILCCNAPLSNAYQVQISFSPGLENWRCLAATQPNARLASCRNTHIDQPSYIAGFVQQYKSFASIRHLDDPHCVRDEDTYPKQTIGVVC